MSKFNNRQVSIVMPSFNCAEFIARSIRSVVSQSFVDWELLVVDDCSTDNTEKIVKEFASKDSRIKYIRLEKNLGVINARQVGIDCSVGRFLAFLDSDDIWISNKLEKQLNILKSSDDVCACCSAYDWIDEHDNKLNKEIHVPLKISYLDVLLFNPIGNSTVLIDRNRINDIKIPKAEKREDFALWLDILRDGKNKILGINEILSSYRIRKGSQSGNKIGLIKYQWNIFRQFEKFSMLNSLLLVVWWCFIKVLKIK